MDEALRLEEEAISIKEMMIDWIADHSAFDFLNSLSQSHQKHSQSVLAASISAICPVLIILCVLNQLLISTCHQLLIQILVSSELVFESFIHNIFLHKLPIFSPWKLFFLPEVEGDPWSCCINHQFFLRLAFEFLALEEVLVGLVNGFPNCKRRLVEVTEVAKWLIFVVEENAVLSFHL